MIIVHVFHSLNSSFECFCILSNLLMSAWLVDHTAQQYLVSLFIYTLKIMIISFISLVIKVLIIPPLITWLYDKNVIFKFHFFLDKSQIFKIFFTVNLFTYLQFFLSCTMNTELSRTFRFSKLFNKSISFFLFF